MADEKLVKFVYHGPPNFIVALQREVVDGDEVEGPDVLEFTAGFTPVNKPVASPKRSDKQED